MVKSCEPVAASAGDRHRPPKATKNTTGVMFERPGASWRHPKATKYTTGVMFEPSQGVLEASRRVPQRPRAYRMPPGVSQSVLEHPESLQECLPGVSWTLEGHKKTLVSSIQCLLEGSGNFVVGLKLFQGVLERFGSLRKRPRASQKSPGMSQSTLQRAPGTLQNVPKRPRVSDLAFANGLQDIRDVSEGFTPDPNARMSAHGSPVACTSLLHASASPCQNHFDHEHRQWRDPGHLKPSHPERNHNPNHKQGQGGICAILLMTCNLRHSWH